MGNTVSDETGPAIRHGGNIAHARALFPQAPEPWIDLSTGINPHSYPHSPLPANAFSRLPDPALAAQLKESAAICYGAPSAHHVAAAPGTQILLPLVAELAGKAARAKAMILSPTYAEHARAARLSGFDVEETGAFERLADADLAIVVNPNNPDGRTVERQDLLALAATLKARRGLLVVDEAFGDVGSGDNSLCGAVGRGALVVLRSFGKFYGMAGLRLGFAVSSPEIVAQLENRLGPWAVSGPALHVAGEALNDRIWQLHMRERLKREAQDLDAVLGRYGLTKAGGTDLFRLVRHEKAGVIHAHLGAHGILVRAFDERPADLRFGLPASPEEWQRLEKALQSLKL